MTKMTFKFVAIFLAVCPRIFAQVAPAATAGNADLHYTFRYSQTAEFGRSLGDWQTISPSAELEYSNGSNQHLFSINYTGGYTSTVGGHSYSTGMFQRLLLSQGIDWPKWNLIVSDDVSYRPQSPTTGFSGIPGIGEPIGGSPPNAPSSQQILTVNTHVVNNTVNGSLGHQLNFATSLNLEASSDLLRYPDGNGLDTNSQMANGGLTFRINARNSLSARYVFSLFSYSKDDSTFRTNSGMFGFERAWSRSLSSSVSAGPEWIGSLHGNAVPASTAISVQAAVNYHLRSGSAGLSYSRGVSGGSGYLMGAESDSIAANFSREFEKKLTLGLTGGYRHTSGLGDRTAIQGTFGGVQASSRVGRYLSVFANYTATNQSSGSSLPTNVLNQLLQVASFGISYSREINHSH